MLIIDMLSCKTSVSDVVYVDGKMSDRVNVSDSAVTAVVIFTKNCKLKVAGGLQCNVNIIIHPLGPITPGSHR